MQRYLHTLCSTLKPGGNNIMNEFVEPLGPRILIRKDESRHQTRGGIVLPDRAEIPTITGRVVEVSLEVANDDEFPVAKYDKVLFHPKNAIPVDLESNNVLFVVPVDDVVAVFRRAPRDVEAAVDDGDEDSQDFSEYDDSDEV
jgi:chaperonin GroES